MNSRQQLHEVHLRGLGGPAVRRPGHLRVRNRGVVGRSFSAQSEPVIPKERRALPRNIDKLARD
jgi:hypothetical protein